MTDPPRAQDDGLGVGDDAAAAEADDEVATSTGKSGSGDTSNSAGGASADEPGQTPDQSGPDATGGAPVDPQPEPMPAGGGSTPPSRMGCDDVCDTLTKCKGEPISDCHERCTRSEWIESHSLHCLALRVYWINEEGCSAMLKTYAAFQQGDDCTGSLEIDP